MNNNNNKPVENYSVDSWDEDRDKIYPNSLENWLPPWQPRDLQIPPKFQVNSEDALII